MNLRAAPLLDLLRRRYKTDDIYTFTGDILISINPYKFIPGLYAISSASGAGAGDDLKVVEYAKEHIPHVYTIAEKSYKMMMEQVQRLRHFLLTSPHRCVTCSCALLLVLFA